MATKGTDRHFFNFITYKRASRCQRHFFNFTNKVLHGNGARFSRFIQFSQKLTLLGFIAPKNGTV